MIKFIPDLNPCLIEGRNGIGKTVAVQLLQLISGQLPHEFEEHADLWISLKRRLNATRLTGTGLDGCERVEVEFTPDAWPEAPEIDGRLGQAWIDGRPAEIGDVAALLQVDRISGNEDLAVSIERHRATLNQQLTLIGARIRERGAAVRHLLGPLLRDLERLDPAIVEDLEEELRRASEALNEARQTASARNARLDKLVLLTEVIRKRDGLDAAEEDLLARHDAAAARIRELEQALATAQEKADRLAQALRKFGGVARDLAETSALLRTRRNRVELLLRQIVEMAGDLGVAAEPSVVAAAIGDCDTQIRTLARRRLELDASGQVRNMLDLVVPMLDEAATRIGDQLLADGFTPALTVRSAATALAARSDALSHEPTPEQVRELGERRRQLTVRREQLASLADRVSKLARAKALVSQAEADYARLQVRDAAATAQATESRAADAEVGRLQHELTAAHEAFAKLAQVLAVQGTMSRQDAGREIASLTRELGVNEQEALAAHGAFRRDVAAADAQAEASRQHMTTVQRRLALTTSELSELAIRLENSPWFPQAPGAPLLRSGDGAVDLERYSAARAAVLAAVATIDGVEEVITRLQGISQQLLEPGKLTPGSLDEYSKSLRAPLAKMLSARILTAFNSPSIQRLVFDGSTATELDPVTRTLTLRSPGGSTDRRPLSSFSTGEQALAFTQARILDLQPSSRPNRLLVLDEFGAFVSADRLPELAEFLASPGVQQVAGQVVVILPLQVDYEAELANTRGSLRETYARRNAQIADFGFAAEALK